MTNLSSLHNNSSTHALILFLVAIQPILVIADDATTTANNTNQQLAPVPVQETTIPSATNSGNTTQASESPLDQAAPQNQPPSQSSETSASNIDSSNIARAQFTSAIDNREPTDNIATLSNNSRKIYFFTELNNLEGKTITHRWEYEGKTMAEIKFNIGGNRWRVYSVKAIKPEWTGAWTVSILDDKGQTIKTNQMEVVAEDASSASNSNDAMPGDSTSNDAASGDAEKE